MSTLLFSRFMESTLKDAPYQGVFSLLDFGAGDGTILATNQFRYRSQQFERSSPYALPTPQDLQPWNGPTL